MDNKFEHFSFKFDNLNNISDSQEFYLIKDNIIHKIITGKYKDKIMIKSKNYVNLFTRSYLSEVIDIDFNSIYNAYDYIKNLLEENKIFIKDIIKNKEIKLAIKNNEEKNIELALKYNKINLDTKDLIISEIKQLKNEINNLKKSNNKLYEQITKLKKYHENDQPLNIELLSNITNDSYSYVNLDNAFTVFNSIDNILNLVFVNKKNSIISYNINTNQKINEIKKAHDIIITNFRHYLDEINKRDLIMSISRNDNNVKIWNIKNWDCLLNIKNINSVGFIYSACFFNDNNQNFIVTSNRNLDGNPEGIKIFDFKGKKLKEIENSKDHTFFIDSYYDNILIKKYIITGNFGDVKTYDFNKNCIYHKYDDNKCINNDRFHCSLIVKKDKKILKILDSSGDGFLRIWNFHSGELLNKIKIGERLYSICLWNDNYLFVGCEDNTIKLIELNYKLIITSFSGHNNWVLSLKKICHPLYGECLLSQNWGESEIKLWAIKI